MPDIQITTSLRVRDKTKQELVKFVKECTSVGFEGVLLVMGDPSQSGKKDTGEIPSSTVNHLRDAGFGSKIRMYLSVPANQITQRWKKRSMPNLTDS